MRCEEEKKGKRRGKDGEKSGERRGAICFFIKHS